MSVEVKVQIPFEALISTVKQLSPVQKVRLQEELSERDQLPDNQLRLTELLQNRPLFTEEQIKTLEETRKSINK